MKKFNSKQEIKMLKREHLKNLNLGKMGICHMIGERIRKLKAKESTNAQNKHIT